MKYFMNKKLVESHKNIFQKSHKKISSNNHFKIRPKMTFKIQKTKSFLKNQNNVQKDLFKELFVV